MVKSAYWLALVMKRAENESTSGPSGRQQLWRSIWSVDVPNKIKNFSWRACQNILPTKANLFHRKVISSEVCEHCDQGRETLSHVLLHFAFAQSVWEACSLVVDRNCTFEDMIWKCRNGSGPVIYELAHFMAIS